MRTLRGATWNIRRDRPARTVRRLTRLIGVRFRLDFILVQEAADYVDELRDIPGYDLVAVGPDRGQGQNLILVRHGVDHTIGRSIDMRGDGWTTVAGDHHVGVSAGTVLLDDWLRVFSVHAPVSVSWPGDRPIGPAERVDDYRRHSSTCLNLARHYATALVFGGDWNARTWETGYWTPRWIARIAGLAMTEPHNRGPGHAGIDYTLSRGCRVTRMRKRLTYGSDHPLVTFVVEEVVPTA